jgi:hypothetical protein
VAVDRLRRSGRAPRFVGEHRQHALCDAAFAQALAHHRRQRAQAGQRNVGDADARRVELVARAHAGCDAQPALEAGRDQRHFAVQRVDAVDDVIEAGRHQIDDVVGRQEFAHQMQLARRIDVADARRHQLGFGLADSGQQRRQLAVDVRRRDHVVIDQRELADPGARERFGAVRTDPAQARDEYVRVREPGEFGRAE